MVLRNRGEISESSVFIRHCWSRVREAWFTSPLLSVTIVEYSIRSVSGKIQFSSRKNKKMPTRISRPFFKEDRVNKDRMNARDRVNKCSLWRNNFFIFFPTAGWFPPDMYFWELTNSYHSPYCK